MKATTAIFFDKYHPKADGTCAISIRITYDRKKKYFNTGVTLDPKVYAKVVAPRPRNEFKDIALKLNEFEGKAAEIISRLNPFSWDAFELKYRDKRVSNGTISEAFDHQLQKLEENEQIGSYNAYKISKSTFLKYSPKAKLTDVTPAFLHKFQQTRLQDGKSITTVSMAVTHLKTLINVAIEEQHLPPSSYPFGSKKKGKYEIPSSKNPKKALLLSEIGKIANLSISDPKIEKARDLFFFLYLCNGINVSDMCRLRWADVKGDAIVFIRKKTEKTKKEVRPIYVPISPEMKLIVEKWGNDPSQEYIFGYFKPGITKKEEVRKTSDVTKEINVGMRTVVKELGLDVKASTYAARHSFATVLQRSNVSTGFISEALGHSSISTTMSYLAGFENDAKREVSKILTDFK